jgi:hypothetical protein
VLAMHNGVSSRSAGSALGIAGILTRRQKENAHDWASLGTIWSRRRESNPRPAHYECAALPTELRRPTNHVQELCYQGEPRLSTPHVEGVIQKQWSG